MEIPRFETQNVNPHLAGADIGDAFQGFVHDLFLPDHPQLHRFPGGGKDGGIDLIETSDSCFVVECKVVGEDDYAQIEQRWKTVKDHLEKHLFDSNGPTKGQSQYLPWYSKEKPIADYVFCTSATFANEQQRRALKTEVANYFHDLAMRRPHLAHLATLKVSVIDWNDLCDYLRKRPHAVFRWFPASRPSGLVPLEETINVGTFRSYLNSDKLPYHSLTDHLAKIPAPKGTIIQDEESLLAHFEDQTTTGLIINGKGGVGKSRLMLELGFRSMSAGWTVMRVQGRLKDDALEKLAEKLTPQTPTLLLVDYIETQNAFGELVEDLNVLNDSGVAHIRYIAACRTGYYHQAIAAIGRHLPVNLSPPPGDASLVWFGKYRSETIRRILTMAGITATERHIKVCHNLPILAVFLAYLHTAGRTEDLTELLAEVDFGRWVAKRVQLSFPARDITRDLALLVPLFPMADADAAKLQTTELRQIFDRLATDGWIERKAPSEPDSIDEWISAHDVLADQILLSYLRSIPYTVEGFVDELLSLAANLNCLASAVVSLQRIADMSPLNSLPWAKLITNAITANESEWRNIRNLLIRTTLLGVPDQIVLLHSHKDLWVDAERDFSFQGALGWRARWIGSADGVSMPKLYKDELISWVLKAAPFADRSNFVITSGLRLAPEALNDIALRWISARPAVFQTHYLMVAWLECGLSADPIAHFVQRWCKKFSKKHHLSFVARAWLEAGGDKTVVEQSVKEWLDAHKTDANAQFIYHAWLNAKGDKVLVEEPIKDWLGVHKTEVEAEFVYRAWLNAGGDTALVEKPIKEWLVVHKTNAEASFVYEAWLNAGGDTALVEKPIKEWLVVYKTNAEASFVYHAWLNAGGLHSAVWDSSEWDSLLLWLAEHQTDKSAGYITKLVAKHPDLPAALVKNILAWCRAFPVNEDVLWRVTQLGKNLLNEDVLDDACATTETLLSHIIGSSDEVSEVTRGQVTTLLNYLVEGARLHSRTMCNRVDTLIVTWMKCPASFGRKPKPYMNIQRLEFARRVLLLLLSGELDFKQDRNSIERFLQWLDEWDILRKDQLHPTIEAYSKRYPAPEVWNIVRFEGQNEISEVE